MVSFTPITSWVKQPTAAIGLDHLGSQAPCINLYGRLLPGITNVTNRARYYSFYTWFLWAYEKQFNNFVLDEIIERFRRADCLFTMIALYHGQKTDNDHSRHELATVGLDTLTEPLKNLSKGQYINLSTFTIREDNNNRYFKNRFGGLGQYYQGTLIELGLMGFGDSNRILNYTFERGENIAKQFDAGVNQDLFFQTVLNDRVDFDILDQLIEFCPCFLSNNNQEQTALLDLFFDRENIYGNEGEQRRHTLCLILHLIQSLENSGFDFNQDNFRGAVYSGSLPDGSAWTIPQSLKSTQLLWQIYQRNELLSIAVQSMFWVALEMLDEMTLKPYTSGEFLRRWQVTDVFKTAMGNSGDILFSKAVSDLKNKLTDLGNWRNSEHEITIGRELPSKIKIKNKQNAYIEMISDSLKILLRLAARNAPNLPAYSNLEYQNGYFDYYPINLFSFNKHLQDTWPKMTMVEFSKWLVQIWGIETHFKVALRKLRRDRRNTFRVYPSEMGLKVDKTPEPVFTNPRFNQGVQILRDLDLICPIEGQKSFELTQKGIKIIGELIED